MKNIKAFLLAMIPTILGACQPSDKVFTTEGNGAVEVSRIDPTDWFVGMQDPTLQLMVYGPGIAEAEVHVDGARIDSVVRLDSPNYLLVYLNLKDAQAGELPIAFCRPGTDDKTIVRYQLHQREKTGAERVGFDCSDVLYMLMPDRFAQGPNHPAQVPGLNAYTENRQEPSLRHGGDLEGIRRHLDYFNELGCGSRPCWRITRPTRAPPAPTMAMPPPTTIGWIPVSAPTNSIANSSTRPTPAA